MAGASDIRVFVKWHERTVFAGEEVRCTITFRNVASAPAPPQRTPRQAPAGLSPSSAGARSTRKLQPPAPRSHRSSTVSGSRPAAPLPLQAAVAGGEGERRGHRKSVSIVSIGSVGAGPAGEELGESHAGRLSRFNRGHGRASSLQMASFPPELSGAQSGMFLPLCA